MPFSRMNSAKSRLVKFFRFFTTVQEDSPSDSDSPEDFLFVAQTAQNPAIDFLVFGEAAVKSAGGWYSV